MANSCSRSQGPVKFCRCNLCLDLASTPYGSLWPWRNPYAFLEQSQARYGDLFVLRLPGMPPCICADPKAVATLTASSYDDCERFGGGAEYFLGPRALICLQGDEHRSLRRQIGPGLHAERLRACLPQMDEEAQKAVAQLRRDQPLPMHEVFQSLTLRIILRCLFGDLPPARAEQLRAATSWRTSTACFSRGCSR